MRLLSFEAPKALSGISLTDIVD